MFERVAIAVVAFLPAVLLWQVVRSWLMTPEQDVAYGEKWLQRSYATHRHRSRWYPLMWVVATALVLPPFFEEPRWENALVPMLFLVIARQSWLGRHVSIALAKRDERIKHLESP